MPTLEGSGSFASKNPFILSSVCRVSPCSSLTLSVLAQAAWSSRPFLYLSTKRSTVGVIVYLDQCVTHLLAQARHDLLRLLPRRGWGRQPWRRVLTRVLSTNISAVSSVRSVTPHSVA